jgi:hypothetical protein
LLWSCVLALDRVWELSPGNSSQGYQVDRNCNYTCLSVPPAVLRSLFEEEVSKAVQPGGLLAGWRLPHVHVVIAGGGAVPLASLEAQDPMPPLLLYVPSPSTAPADGLDFDGPDGPYRLIGWGYIAADQLQADPPRRQCVAASEWIIHEAGWAVLSSVRNQAAPEGTPGPSFPPDPLPLTSLPPCGCQRSVRCVHCGSRVPAMHRALTRASPRLPLPPRCCAYASLA